MLLFCPGCGNGLIVEEGQRCHRFACNTCPYVHNITRKVRFGPAFLPPPGPSPSLFAASRVGGPPRESGNKSEIPKAERSGRCARWSSCVGEC
ncbi:DNA-directed RNA polymerase III subunit RPC10 isoform X1 [Manis javanica]|uniref:DNA-directed RNA polymerase III subunit RPC10 isoform X1 n=1 Tax=Manis javanica TaxID=9974 RepID=UPI00187936CA|nr:DNA-directed RNA polymerase III subunit RPC10 isoform X1 [Manis javanica]